MSAIKTKPIKRPANGSRTPKIPGSVDCADVLTLAEAAAYLRISELATLQAVRDQGLPARQFDNEWRFFKPAIQDWMRLEPRQKKGILAHIGAFKDDPDLEEMLKETHKRRGRPETQES